MGGGVGDGHHRRAALGGREENRSVPARVERCAPRGLEPADLHIPEETPRAGHDDDVRCGFFRYEVTGGRDRLRHERPADDDLNHRCVGPQVGVDLPCFDESVSAGQDVLAPSGPAEPGDDRRRLRLIDRPRGKSQVRAVAGSAGQACFDPREQCPGDLLSESWLVGDQPGQLDTQRWRDRRLVGASFCAEADARRRAHQDEPRSAIQPVDQAVERAADERVIDRSDWNQGLAEELAGEAELAQPHEQVHLADTKLDMLASGTRLPFQDPGTVLE